MLAHSHYTGSMKSFDADGNSVTVLLADGATAVPVDDFGDPVTFFDAKDLQRCVLVHCGPRAPLPERWHAEPRWMHRESCYVELVHRDTVYTRVECSNYRQQATRKMLAELWGVETPPMCATSHAVDFLL